MLSCQLLMLTNLLFLKLVANVCTAGITHKHGKLSGSNNMSEFAEIPKFLLCALRDYKSY